MDSALGYTVEEWAAIIAYAGWCPLTFNAALDMCKEWIIMGRSSISVFLDQMPKELDSAYKVFEIVIYEAYKIHES